MSGLLVADEISLVRSAARIRERIELWRKTPVTTLLIGSRDPEVLHVLADLTSDAERLLWVIAGHPRDVLRV